MKENINTREIILLRELTAEERKVFELLKLIKGNNTMTLGIKYTIENEDVKGFRRMLQDIKDSAKTNTEVVALCIGYDFLKTILDVTNG